MNGGSTLLIMRELRARHRPALYSFALLEMLIKRAAAEVAAEAAAQRAEDEHTVSIARTFAPRGLVPGSDNEVALPADSEWAT